MNRVVLIKWEFTCTEITEGEKKKGYLLLLQ